MNHRKRFGRLSAGLGASVALLSGLLVMDIQPGGALNLSVTNVTAGISVPSSAHEPFTATGTITNTGNVAQLGDSKVTISVTNGVLTAAPGCTIGEDGAAVCTAPDLLAGAAASFDVTVTPSTIDGSVTTTVTTLGALPDVNAPDVPPAADDDIATATTTNDTISNVTAGISAASSEPAAFTATGTITNTGNVAQPAGSTVTISASDATVSTTDPSCDDSSGAAVCTASDLSPGVAASFTVTVTPTAESTSVTTTATTLGALADVNAPDVPPGPDDDIATAITIKTISNVTAAVSVPKNSAGQFTATGTITNTGNAAQLGDSFVTISAPDATVSVTDPSCGVSSGAAVCTAPNLLPGAAASFTVTVTPSTIDGLVTTTVTTTEAQPDVNAPAADDDVASDSTRNYEHSLEPGDTACHNGETETNCMTNTSGKAIFVTLDEVDVSASCGGSACFGRAPHAAYPAGGDPGAPLTWQITPDQKFACAGKGNECLKNVLYYVLDGQTGGPIKVPLCASYSNSKPKPAIADPSGAPCINFIGKAGDGRVTWYLALVGDIAIPRIIG